MPGFTSSATIERPKGAVFAFITDFDNAPRLSPGVVGIEPVTEGEPREGYVFRETRRVGKREATAEIRISAFDPPDKYAATSEWKNSAFTYTYTRKMPPRAGPK